MNLKKAKRIRKQLRVLGINPRQAEYDLDHRSQQQSNMGQLSPFQVTIALVTECGRKAYKQIKRVYSE